VKKTWGREDGWSATLQFGPFPKTAPFALTEGVENSSKVFYEFFTG
jgi:hypothetical protein